MNEKLNQWALSDPKWNVPKAAHLSVSPYIGLFLMVFIFSPISHDCTHGSKSINSRIGPEGSSKLLPLSKMPKLFHSSSSGLFWLFGGFTGMDRNLSSRLCVYVCVHVCACVYVCAYMCTCMYVSLYCVCMHVYVCEIQEFKSSWINGVGQPLLDKKVTCL